MTNYESWVNDRSEYIDLNDEEQKEELRKSFIRDTAGYILIQALEQCLHGGNLIKDRMFRQITEVHGCQASYPEIQQAMNNLADAILEEIEGL